MNLMELFVKIGVDDQASSKISNIAGGLKNSLKTAAKVATVAVAGASTAIGALTTGAVKQFAEYEQLVGGVDTLFKTSSKSVQKYASEAYKTAGMSANEYMETATSFSASLIQSLGGDTKKSADYANVAITDMADNANKMGSDIATLQTAYAGFAKQNFTMLDNLKLGYGGTKEEMERLLADAEKLSGIKYDISSFADITQAIHVMQEEMGIAGATADEAGRTISGAVGAMKGAWRNLITGVADGSADIGNLIDDLVESVVGDGTSKNLGVLGNVIPAVERALDGAMQLVDGIIPKIVELVPSYVSKYLPKILNSGVNIVKSLAKGIKNNAKTIVTAAKDTFFAFIDAIPDLIPDMIGAAVELFSNMVAAIPEVAIKITKAMPQIIEAVLKGIATGAIKIVQAFVGIFTGAVDESREVVDGFANSLSAFTPFVDKMDEFAGKTADVSRSLSDSGKTISDLDSEISSAEDSITTILKTAFSDQDKLRQQDIYAIEQYNKRIAELQSEKIGVYQEAQLAEYRRTMLDLSDMDVMGLAESVSRAQSALDAANAAVEDSYIRQLTQIENLHKALNTVGTEAYNEDLRKAKAERDLMIEENERLYVQTAEAIGARSASISSSYADELTALANFRTKYGKEVEKINEELQTVFGDLAVDIGKFATDNAWAIDLLGLTDDTTVKFVGKLDDLNFEALNAFLLLQSSLVNQGAEIDKESKEILNSMLKAFEPMPGEMGEASEKGLRALISGLESEIPALRNAGEMTAEEIIDAIESHFRRSNISLKMSVSGTATVHGSHESGLSYVPFDGYIAQLHKGERVLTKEEAKSYSSSVGKVTININGAKYHDEQSLAYAVAEAMQSMTDRKVAVYA